MAGMSAPPRCPLLLPRPQTPISHVELGLNKFSQNARDFSVTSFLAAPLFNEVRGQFQFDLSVKAHDDAAAKAESIKTTSGGRWWWWGWLLFRWVHVKRNVEGTLFSPPGCSDLIPSQRGFYKSRSINTALSGEENVNTPGKRRAGSRRRDAEEGRGAETGERERGKKHSSLRIKERDG